MDDEINLVIQSFFPGASEGIRRAIKELESCQLMVKALQDFQRDALDKFGDLPGIMAKRLR